MHLISIVKDYLKKNSKKVLVFLAGIFIWILVKENILSCPALGYLFFGAVEFDGINGSHIEVSSGNDYDFGPGDSFSVAFWLQVNNVPALAVNFILDLRTGGSLGWTINYDTGGDIRFGGRDDDNTLLTPSVTSIDNIKWHHYGWVFDRVSTKVKVHKDGVLVDDTQSTVGIVGFADTSTMVMGASAATKVSVLNGSLTEVCIYPVALSLNQVKNLASRTKFVPSRQIGGAIADFPLDDGVPGESAHGDSARDLSPNNNPGAINNGVTWKGEVLTYTRGPFFIQEVEVVPVVGIGAMVKNIGNLSSIQTYSPGVNR